MFESRAGPQCSVYQQRLALAYGDTGDQDMSQLTPWHSRAQLRACMVVLVAAPWEEAAIAHFLVSPQQPPCPRCPSVLGLSLSLAGDRAPPSTGTHF